MRLFLYEYLSARGGGALPASLRREGWAMLAALAADFSALDGLEVCTLLSKEVPQDLGHRCRRVDASEEPQAFRDCARNAEATLVIAPEFDDFLAQRSQWALEEGSALLGSPPELIRTVSDKIHLAAILTGQRIPTPPLLVPRDGESPSLPFPWILKPRFGAGCRGLRRIDKPEDWLPLWGEASAESPGSDRLVQPLLPGRPASASFLIGSGEMIPLLPGFQHLRRTEHGFAYQGGEIPLPPNLERRALDRTSQALACFPGLRGFVGVDLLLGETADGSEDYVIEINPRPTTSYVGLRQICLGNLAQVWWAVWNGQEAPLIIWKPGPVRFDGTGTITS